MSETETPSRWIEYRNLADIPDALVNPKTHDIHGIAHSIREFGVAEPAVLDERTGRLLHGHGRRDALRHLHADNQPAPNGIHTTNDGTWQAPVLRGWSSRDDNHAHATAIALNRHTETGGWDKGELLGVLEELATSSPELPSAAGFSLDAIDDLRATLEEIDTSGNENPFTHNPGPDLAGNVTRDLHGDEERARYELHDQRSIVLGYEGARYVWIVEKLTELAAAYQLESNAEVVLRLVERATNSHAPTLGGDR